MACGLEHQFIVGGLSGFKQEHLDEGTCLLAEMHACLDHLRVVEHHQSALRQILREVIKHIGTHLTLVVDEELGMIALGDGKFGNTLVGQRIVVVADMDMTGIYMTH